MAAVGRPWATSEYSLAADRYLMRSTREWATVATSNNHAQRPRATRREPRATCTAAQSLLATQWASRVLGVLGGSQQCCCALRAGGGRSADRGGDRGGARRLREAEDEGQEGQRARSARRTACRRPSGAQHAAEMWRLSLRQPPPPNRRDASPARSRRRMRSIANDRFGVRRPTAMAATVDLAHVKRCDDRYECVANKQNSSGRGRPRRQSHRRTAACSSSLDRSATQTSTMQHAAQGATWAF